MRKHTPHTKYPVSHLKCLLRRPASLWAPLMLYGFITSCSTILAIPYPVSFSEKCNHDDSLKQVMLTHVITWNCFYWFSCAVIVSHSCLDTATFPCRVPLHDVVYQVVIQERQVVVVFDWSTAGGGRGAAQNVFLTAGEAGEDFVIVCEGVYTDAAAVAEYQLLLTPVAQTQIRHFQLDLS